MRGSERIQIKGRAYDRTLKRSQRLSRIKADAPCDTALMVLLDVATLDAFEMWEAPMAAVRTRLAVPSKSRERGALGVSEFKALGQRVWPFK